ncbi:MAG: LacI family DNA-binding transcriptional regulator [Planctomycetes bacterium]|nr:LacI family DNA-binding transcriptional regulator [Planctomycetota bacterium]
MTITIKDIAKKAQVSETTVSLAFQKESRIGSATREKVLAVAKELKYVPNLSARQLRNGKTKLIGILVNDIAYGFYGQVMKLAEQVAHERGYHCVFASSNFDANKESRAIDEMLQSRISGLLGCFCEKDNGVIDLLEAQKIPHIAVDTTPINYDGAYVVTDHFQTGKLIADHLHEQGYTHPHMFSSSVERAYFTAFKEMQRGFTSVFKDAQVHQVGVDIKSATNYCTELFNNGANCDAIFCVNDDAAFGVLDALKLLHKKPGSDVAVVGVNDTGPASLSYISLSSISEQSDHMITTACNALIDAIENNQPVDLQESLAPALHIRQSSQN